MLYSTGGAPSIYFSFLQPAPGDLRGRLCVLLFSPPVKWYENCREEKQEQLLVQTVSSIQTQRPLWGEAAVSLVLLRGID